MLWEGLLSRDGMGMGCKQCAGGGDGHCGLEGVVETRVEYLRRRVWDGA